MQAWRLRVQDADGHNITLLAALKRYLVAYPSLLAFGLGYWLMLLDPMKRSWSDLRFGHARGALHPTVTLLPSGSARLVLSQRPRKKPNP